MKYRILLTLLLLISIYDAKSADENGQRDVPEATVRILSVKRSSGNPLITPESSKSLGNNLNGPSVIHAPSWVKDPLGNYYMYFAHHQGSHIRLAYANSLHGPWKIHEPGTLKISEMPGWGGHVASPDVHVDEEKKLIRMYFHACRGIGQINGTATSTDGIQFKVSDTLPGGWYFRVFEYDGVYYGIDRSGDLYRSKDPLGSFEKRKGSLMPGEIRDKKLIRQVRHTAVLRKGNLLLIFYSRTGDTPERILLSTVKLSSDWSKWVCSAPVEVIQPETEYEGIQYPLKTSTGGVAPKHARELRDPGIFEENGKYYLFYSIAGESGIAMAEVALEMDQKIEKDFAMAMSDLNALKDIADEQGQVQIRMARAKVYYGMENYSGAREEIERVLKQDPKHAEALILMGKCQLKMHDDNNKRELECFIDENVVHEVKLGAPIIIKLLAPSVEFTGDIEVVIASGLGDREIITLQPIEADKTRFHARLQTKAGNPQPDDKVLQTQVGDEITIEYSPSAKAKMKVFTARASKCKIVAGD